jgi:hypothetical protein
LLNPLQRIIAPETLCKYVSGKTVNYANGSEKDVMIEWVTILTFVSGYS